MVLSIAGQTVDLREAAEILAKYPNGTIRWYDLGGGDNDTLPDAVTLADLGRLAVINADLTGNDAVALLELGRTAPWSPVPHDADLADADPEVSGGLYDEAVALYTHFTSQHGIADAKASKLLHLKRPNLIPILDSQLKQLYRDDARRAASDSRHQANFLYWTAIRNDLVANEAALEEVRTLVADREVSVLGDLRLLDIIAWWLMRHP